MSQNEANKRNLNPLAKIISWATCGVDPSLMGSGPIPASKKALEKAGWKINDLDLIEANEAFAAQSLAVIKDLGIPKDKAKCKWWCYCSWTSYWSFWYQNTCDTFA